MGQSQSRQMAEDTKTVGAVFVASLPTAVAAGVFAIGALLVNVQIQSARIEATIHQMAASLEELKIDSRTKLADLDKRVRVLEIGR
jgi:hypothetical protein